jgi:hypothetical protein
MRIFLLAGLLLLITTPGWALSLDSDPWSVRDTTLQVVYTALVLIDWNQTLDFRSRQGGSCHDGTRKESNPILGPCPSRARVNALIGSAILAHAAVTYLLPADYRPIWQGIFITLEIQAVHRNAQKRSRSQPGLKIDWRVSF